MGHTKGSGSGFCLGFTHSLNTCSALLVMPTKVLYEYLILGIGVQNVGFNLALKFGFGQKSCVRYLPECFLFVTSCLSFSIGSYCFFYGGQKYLHIAEFARSFAKSSVFPFMIGFSDNVSLRVRFMWVLWLA